MANNRIPELQVNVNSANNRLYCPHEDCEYNGSIYWRIRDHILSTHLDTAPWPCPAHGCNEGLNTKPALEIHARGAHDDDTLRTVLNLMNAPRTVTQLPDNSIVVQYGDHVVAQVPVTIPGMPSTDGAGNPNRRTTVWAPAASQATTADVPSPASHSDRPETHDQSPNGDHGLANGVDSAPCVLTNGVDSASTVSSPMSEISDKENQDYLADQQEFPTTNGHVENDDTTWHYEGQYSIVPSTEGGSEPHRYVLAQITQTPDALSSIAHGYHFVYPAFAPTDLHSGYAPGPSVHARPLSNGAYYDDSSQMGVQTIDHHQYNLGAQYQQQVPTGHIHGHPDYQHAQMLQSALFEHLEHSPLEQFQPSPFDNYRQLSFEQHMQAHHEEEQVSQLEHDLQIFVDQDQEPEAE